MRCFILLLLTGCASPYLDIGAGYRDESGDYLFDESCALGYYAVGLEFEHKVTLEYQHTSCFTKKPEIVTRDIIIKKRFGGRR